MAFIDFVFFFYMFVGLYMLSLLFLLYIQNRKRVFDYPKGKAVPVSIIVPCYNAEKSIGRTLDSLLKLKYDAPIEIIVVDDKSKDNSTKVVSEYAKRYDNIRLIVNERNSGRAAEPTNIGVKAAKYDYVAVTDDDSTPEEDALIKMIGFLQEDDRVSAVTCAVLAKHTETFMQKLQAIEYTVIAWSRKLLDLVDCVYVTPGPFALYRRDRLIEVGLFDTNNMTQDIEIVWRLISRGYIARMCLSARVHSETPRRLKAWFRQRIRWNIGGTQTLLKYKKYVFQKGMLGAFIIPFFSLSLFLGLIGLGIFLYLFTRRIAVFYLSSLYSVEAQTTILRLSELSFSASILNYFGIILFLLGASFTFFGLTVMGERKLYRYDTFFNVMFYMIVYLMIYPIIMITGLYKFARGKYSW